MLMDDTITNSFTTTTTTSTTTAIVRSFFFSFERADQPLNLHNGKISFTIHCMRIIVRVLATNPAIRNKNGL